MALFTLSGEPGCRHEEAARICASLLSAEVIGEARVWKLIAEEFGPDAVSVESGYVWMLTSIVARLAREHHLILTLPGAEFLHERFPALFRVHLTAPEPRRIGSLMIDRRLDRPAALKLLREMDREQKSKRQQRFRQALVRPHHFDLLANTEALEPAQIAELVNDAVQRLGLLAQGFLPARTETQLQFQARLHLAKFQIAPTGKAMLRRATFANPSEELFASLLDFYRIAWEYEPRSFPLQWDKQGNVTEAFTPDFYLPDVDLFVELTTMKQANVTRKNRKVKRLRALHPNINIQVFYQRDFENLIFKYGLAESPIPA